MSDLVYQNYNNRCQGWTPPSSLTGPQISSLSGYQSPAGSSTVVSISGVNFFSYSTIRFGTFTPTTYFINSNIIQFYIPNTLSSGTFPVQVFNGSIPSNIVLYTIDNASGYWLLNPGGSISNTNSNGVQVSWLSRGAPYTITSDYNFTDLITNPNANNISWFICNGTTSINITLPSAYIFNGREIMFKNITNNQVNSSYGISPLNGGPITPLLLPANAPGSWVTIVSDGAKWIIMQAN
jgi:hypothetical protein